MFDYKLRVPGGIYLLFRVLAILEGIGKIIHPSFRTEEYIRPYGIKLVEEKLNPKYLAEDFLGEGAELWNIISGIPSDLKSIIRLTKKGRLSVRIEHTGYGKALETFNRGINRMILAFIIIALLISSSLTTDVNTGLLGKKVLGVSYLSSLLFVGSVFLGVVLLYNVLRSRKY